MLDKTITNYIDKVALAYNEDALAYSLKVAIEKRVSMLKLEKLDIKRQKKC